MASTGNPLDHVVQHPIVEKELDAGVLTPEGVITLLSDHIVMIILAGVLLCVFLPWAFRRSRQEGVEGLVASGFSNFIEAICEYLRKEVAEPALAEHTDRFIKYVWSVFFFVLTVNLLGLLPIGVITPLALSISLCSMVGPQVDSGSTVTTNIQLNTKITRIKPK